jgi:hypothetical protein
MHFTSCIQESEIKKNRIVFFTQSQPSPKWLTEGAPGAAHVDGHAGQKAQANRFVLAAMLAALGAGWPATGGGGGAPGEGKQGETRAELTLRTSAGPAGSEVAGARRIGSGGPRDLREERHRGG